MTCSPAPACRQALAEASQRWPGRSTRSDGICPSAEHSRANPRSDHEGGNAWDLTHDPAHGVDCRTLSRIVARDPRAKYVIFDGQIGPPWRPYNGGPTGNMHREHMHVSIVAAVRDDTSPWFGTAGTTPGIIATAPATGPSTSGDPASVLAAGSTWMRVLGVLVGLVLLGAGLFLVIGEQTAREVVPGAGAVLSVAAAVK